MTTPHLPAAPDDSFEFGSDYGSNLNETSIMAIATGGAKTSFTGVQGAIGTQIRDPLGGAIVNSGTALTEAQAAVNAAANASQKADFAYAAATEWSLEWSAASAEVTEGAGEVLVGPMVAVRDGRDAILTDINIALLEQHDGLTVQTRIWNAANTAYTVVHTAVIGANETRRKFTALTVTVLDDERLWTYVTDIVGTVPPTVLQVHVSGVYIDEEE
ncbi:hypothetical protein [Nocardia sp. NPDC057440]|uniref:hypothetical protein n=1 Tax=Nocardia sp. NPDC057440 TaxID=3346134 RepID=UPI0036728214